jgi:hypothetical protein
VSVKKGPGIPNEKTGVFAHGASVRSTDTCGELEVRRDAQGAAAVRLSARREAPIM